jgi:hypothetical protein
MEHQAHDWQQQQLESERLERTLNALDEINGCGLTDTAKFLASELGVSGMWKPEEINV